MAAKPDDYQHLVCDESKCRTSSRDGYPNEKFPFDCHVRPDAPLLCDVGYVGQLVDTESEDEKIQSSISWNPIDTNPTDFLYYTCCPKGYNGTIGKRHCGSPNTLPIGNAENENNISISIHATICPYESERKYPRIMSNSAYICCDFALNSTDAPFKDDNILDRDNISSDICDESKCISQANSRYQFGYSCRGGGPGTLFPFRCDDGYKGRKVDNALAIWNGVLGVSLYYYTCCPPDYPDETSMHRKCSLPIITTDSSNETRTCDNDDNSTFIHRRDMKRAWNSLDTYTDAYVCCDSIIDRNNKTNFLDEADCVPRCRKDSYDYLDCLTGNL